MGGRGLPSSPTSPLIIIAAFLHPDDAHLSAGPASRRGAPPPWRISPISLRRKIRQIKLSNAQIKLNFGAPNKRKQRVA